MKATGTMQKHKPIPVDLEKGEGGYVKQGVRDDGAKKKENKIHGTQYQRPLGIVVEETTLEEHISTESTVSAVAEVGGNYDEAAATDVATTSTASSRSSSGLPPLTLDERPQASVTSTAATIATTTSELLQRQTTTPGAVHVAGNAATEEDEDEPDYHPNRNDENQADTVIVLEAAVEPSLLGFVPDEDNDPNNNLDAVVNGIIDDSDHSEDQGGKVPTPTWFWWAMGIILFGIVGLIAVTVSILVLPSAKSPAEDLISTPSPTSSPTQESLLDWFRVMEDVIHEYQPENLRDPTTPQGKAARWIASEDEISNGADASMTSRRWLQRFALAVFYFSMDGENWRECSRTQVCPYNRGTSWLRGDTHECTWLGVTCRRDEEVVTGIAVDVRVNRRLTGNNEYAFIVAYPLRLSGTLPLELALLTDLERVWLPDMEIVGSIDVLVSSPGLRKLKKIDLSKNPYLTDGGRLSGTLPDSLWRDRPNLEVLNLSGNRIAGTIPTDFGTEHGLEWLDLSLNALVGPIPSNIHQLSQLKRLSLSGNKELHGTIPSSLGQIDGLASLRLSDAPLLQGGIPNELYQLNKLITLDLTNTPIGGRISQDIRHWNRTLSSLRLSNTNLSGTIPSSLGLCTNLKALMLGENPNLSGNLPEDICELARKQYLNHWSVDDHVGCTCCGRSGDFDDNNSN